MNEAKPSYPRIRQWIQEYGIAGSPERSSIESFMEVENAETIASLRAELIGVSKGNYDDEAFDKLVGRNRKAKFGSYADWAKMLLLWMASKKG